MEGKSGGHSTNAVDARDSRAVAFYAIVMPASRAIIQLNGLIAGKTTWYGEGLHNDGLIP